MSKNNFSDEVCGKFLNSNDKYWTLMPSFNINKILLNYMPKDHDVSSFNQTYGYENLKKWLTKNVKLTD